MEESCGGSGSRRKEQEAIEVEDPRKALVGPKLRGEWKQKKAPRGYRSGRPQEGRGRNRAAEGKGNQKEAAGNYRSRSLEGLMVERELQEEEEEEKHPDWTSYKSNNPTLTRWGNITYQICTLSARNIT